MPRKKGDPLSPAELEQRRDAAVNSTGPTTDAGKKRSAMNAWKHGQTAQSRRSQLVGKPCLSTCPKHPCVFVTEGKTEPGGKCLDTVKWEVIEESADAIIQAQNGDMGKLQGISAMIMGQSIAFLQKLFEEIDHRGVWLTEDIINAEGEMVGTRERENPLIGIWIKMQEKLGINLPEFLATPQAQAKVQQDDEAHQTAAELTRQLSRLIPEQMRSPAFDPSEVTDAEVVDDGKS